MNEQLVQRVQELTSRFRIRHGEPTLKDAQLFIKLFNTTYARHVTEEYYFWQFFRSPLKGICLFVEDGRRTVAVHGLRRLPWKAFPSQVIGLSVDVIIIPEYHRTGLFTRLDIEIEKLALESNCVCLYAMPNAAGYRPRISALGWISLDERITYMAQTIECGKSDERLSFKKVDEFNENITEIQRAFQQNHPDLEMVQRTNCYLNWRFKDNPWYKYDLFIVKRHGEIFGYLVLKTFHDPKTSQIFGDILDLLWVEDDPKALIAMLRFALSYFHVQGISQATIWLQTNTILDHIGLDLGFVETEQRRYFCCKVLNGQNKFLEDSKNWFVTMADSEIY